VIEEMTRTQPRGVKDIRKLRSFSHETSPPSIATRPVTAECSRRSFISPIIAAAVIAERIVGITSYMRRKMTTAVVVGIIIVD
jgi:hypothetical protein